MHQTSSHNPCPCGSQNTFADCCEPTLKGQTIEHPERLIRARYTAAVRGDIKFLWDTLHPQGSIKLKYRWVRFEKEQTALSFLSHKGLHFIDEKTNQSGTVLFVYQVDLFDKGQDITYVEEAECERVEEKWFYKEGVRCLRAQIKKNSQELKVGELVGLFKWDGGLN